VKVFAWITALLLLTAAGAHFYFGDRSVAANEQASSSSASPASAPVRTFPPAETDSRPPILPDGTRAELCGYGQILARPDTYPYPASVHASARQLLTRVADDLSTSDEPGNRAVAMYYRTISRRATDASAFLARSPNCEKDPVCRERFYGEGLQTMRAATDQLARSVATTRDGRAYATAWYLCGKAYPANATVGPCTQVTAARWGELEPGNAMPWIIEAGRASRAGDSVSVEAAMTRATEASFSNLHWFATYALASHPLLKKADQATQLVAMTELVGIASALPFPSMDPITRRCRGLEPLTDDRRRQCLAIASALSNGSTHLELSLGAALGKAVGWTDAQVAAVRDKSAAILAANIDRVHPDDVYSCDFLDALTEKLPALARLGEIGAGEKAIKRSGKSERELVEEFRTASRWQRERAQPK
jgi:aminoglycoside phosphotransferase